MKTSSFSSAGDTFVRWSSQKDTACNAFKILVRRVLGTHPAECAEK
jgi:hypothetical protein